MDVWKIGPYVDGELPRAEREEVEAHLRECPDCEKLTARFRTLDSLAGRDEVPPVSAEEWSRILDNVTRQSRITALASPTSIHGSLADVYGVGLLFTGQSGIGKSECVLDLVERGHRLVADDLVCAHRRHADVLIGCAHEDQRHHMEIRGVGIIDVRAMFGVRAVRQQKRIEVVVELEVWGKRDGYDRTGLETEQVELLGVTLPKVVIPLNPGKNLTVIAEVVAMNHLLRYSGEDSAVAFERRLLDRMRPLRDYLEVDDE